jgi:hypothetical protein
MFIDGECMFAVCELMFKGLEHKFIAHEYKIALGENRKPSGTRYKYNK